ncbi:sigma 54-interacting transcriptional regulator [Polyangium sorediatum]|uniref:Sigma 54-interacting transcriptional regulator n=1 Tax=Polyangium sorediatum TaxID=889274 RepID=A0ABT6P9Z7_9BACT|nr:sigma 54-interacting transcriptional regulator [Polyangium sorediatum]MDI1437456.1 sigma 54-interacting transcriptional regulator [Polyangium sorediatum]
MVETLSNTKTEHEPPTQSRSIGVLVFVLRYDDLLAGDAFALPPLARSGATIEIHRAPRVQPVSMDGKTLLLPDPYVSRSHAVVARAGHEDRLEDRGSRYGTFVNGAPIDAPRPLADGDVIEIGHSLFVYRLVNEAMAMRLAAHPTGLAHGPTRTLCPEVVQLALDLERVARTDQPVMLLAETGAGKEIAARYVHEKSGRAGPCGAIDCGAIPGDMIEAELFGHRRGAFTGAHEERRGRIRSADGGTVFLDEIGNLPEAAQASLLRVLQEREVTPVGADRAHKVDVRWVAATNADVFAPGARFRADLRTRLAGYVGRIPPLRRRREDLGLLGAHILAKADVARASITKKAARALLLGELPGNIRELGRALTSAAVLAGDGAIDVQHLSVLAAREASESGEVSLSPSDPEETSEARKPRQQRPDRAVIEGALDKARGVQGEAARLLGVHERQLARWMDALGIPRGRARVR